jgi:hypothetical protein
MTEFRVLPNPASDRRRDRTIRLVLWGVVFILSGITCFAISAARWASYQTNIAVTALAILILIGAVGGAHYLAIRMGLERMKRNSVYELTETDLVRKRSGETAVRIGLSEVSTLSLRPDWLVVESFNPLRRIAIPKEVGGFALLQAELAKHAAIVKVPERSPLAFVPAVASFFCWALVLMSTDAGVVRIAAAIGLVLMACSSFHFVRLLRRSPKRVLLWMWLAISWAAMLWVVYSRTAR